MGLCSSLSSYPHLCTVLTLVLTFLFSFALTPPHIAYPNLLFKDNVLLTLPPHQFLSFTWFILFDDIKVVVFVHVFLFIYLRGAAHENGVLFPKDTALGAASVLEGLIANIALCPATPEIRRLFTAGTWSSVQTSHAQRNIIWCKK